MNASHFVYNVKMKHICKRPNALFGEIFPSYKRIHRSQKFSVRGKHLWEKETELQLLDFLLCHDYSTFYTWLNENKISCRFVLIMVWRSNWKMRPIFLMFKSNNLSWNKLFNGRSNPSVKKINLKMKKKSKWFFFENLLKHCSTRITKKNYKG